MTCRKCGRYAATTLHGNDVRATEQGISQVFVSELGDTKSADESARPCVEKLIDYWDGRTSGVFMLDMPSGSPNGASIKDSWQEEVLTALR